MRRRDLIAGLGAAAAWPLAARAQQAQRLRRVGVLMGLSEGDPEGGALISSFTERLSDLGWTESRNLRMDVRWAVADASRMRAIAKEMVDLQPEVIVAHTTSVTAALQRETRIIPIVFSNVADPSGFVEGLPRPGGNITGFLMQEPSLAGKWLGLLKEIAPAITRVAIMFNPDTAPSGGSYYLPSFEAAARSLKVVPIIAPVYGDVEIETAIIALGREPGGGLVGMPDIFVNVHRASMILAAARNNVPAVYFNAFFVKSGGLLSYGPNEVDIFRSSASYVDRILRGAKPADLPVQLPTKFEMAVNLKTAKALGLAVPQSILLRADEVIE
jgi:putative tryptophan/tyrosine transport system substrate-binding protein